jgi:hypothetical protein
MALTTCPTCHERFRFDSRVRLEAVSRGDGAQDEPTVTYTNGDLVVHSCPTSISATRREEDGAHSPERTALR